MCVMPWSATLLDSEDEAQVAPYSQVDLNDLKDILESLGAWL